MARGFPVKKPLSRRLFAVLAIPLLCVGVGLAMVAFLDARRQLNESARIGVGHAVTVLAPSVARSLALAPDKRKAALRGLLQRARLRPEVANAWVEDPTGRLVAFDSAGKMGRPPQGRVYKTLVRTGVSVLRAAGRFQGRRYLVVATLAKDRGGKPVAALVAHVDLSALQLLALRQVSWVVGIYFTGMLTLLLLLRYLIGRIVVRPLMDICRQAAEIPVPPSDISRTSQIESGDEISHLAHLLRRFSRALEENTRSLSEASTFLQNILDSSLDHAIVAFDRHWTVLAYNEGAKRLFGYQPDDVLSVARVAKFHPPGAFETREVKAMYRRVELGEKFGGEVTLRRVNGQEFPSQLVLHPRRDRTGKRLGYLLIATDITESKLLEKQLHDYTKELERLVAERTWELEQRMSELRARHEEVLAATKLKDEFLAVISHELRTPLNAILGFTALTLEDDEKQLSEDQKDNLEKVQKNGEHLLALINDILDLSKIEAGRLRTDREFVDLVMTMEYSLVSVQPQAEAKGLQIDLKVPEGVPAIRTDARRLRQIVVNLLSNAVKFTQEGTITLALQLADDSVTLLVRDTGIGISAKDLALIFEPFRQADGSSTRAAGGTGLGLTIAQRLSHLLGGELKVRSMPGIGSEFSLVLPAEYPPDAELPPPVELEDPFGDAEDTQPEILVVEPHPASLRGPCGFLRLDGAFRIRLAMDSGAATEMLGDALPDLIIVDLGSEKGGVETILDMRSEPAWGKIPILATHDRLLTPEEEEFMGEVPRVRSFRREDAEEPEALEAAIRAGLAAEKKG